MRPTLLVAAVVAASLLVVAPPAAPRDHSGAVTDWIEVELAQIASHRTNPPRASRGLAVLSVAMLDATRVPPGHRRAAVAGAAATVLSLTDEQKRIADFWADGAGTVTPSGHWNRIAIGLIRSHDVADVASARIFAALNTAQADAFIACWDAKFTYWSERPVTAIRRELDPTWLSYITTPPFPSYVSGHSTTSSAASEVLGAYFPGSASTLRSLAEEAAASRLYGGIHFRSDNETGLALGEKVAGVALTRYGLSP